MSLKAVMKSIFADSVGSLIAQPLNSRFHLVESPCKLNFITRARLSDSNDGDLIILALRGNFFFFSRSSVDMLRPPAWLSRMRTECHRLFLVSGKKSSLFEVSWKVELGGSSSSRKGRTTCFLGCRGQRGWLFATARNETANKLEVFSESDCREQSVVGNSINSPLQRKRSARTDCARHPITVIISDQLYFENLHLSN